MRFRPWSQLVSWFAQCVAVTGMSLRSLPRRAAASAVAAVGVTGVVLVLVAVLSIAEGFQRTLASSGSEESVIVLRSGSSDELSSGFGRQTARLVAEAPGVARGADGPLASAELFVIVDLPLAAAGSDANVPLRGVGPEAFAVRDGVKIVAGRSFEPGRHEVIAGVGAAASFAGLDVGETLTLGDDPWTVVGHFSATGSAAESEVWADVRVVQPAFRRGDTFSSVRARLTSADAFAGFAQALADEPRVNVKARRESEFYAEQSKVLTALVRGLGFLVAGLMGTGAVFAAVNTLHAAVAARGREIATLRAVGFRPGPVVVSVLTEALVLGLAGGLAGGAAAWLGFHGYRASTLNWSSFSQVSFAFAVTPELIVRGIVFALVIGFAAGLLPALRAARTPVARALREP